MIGYIKRILITQFSQMGYVIIDLSIKFANNLHSSRRFIYPLLDLVKFDTKDELLPVGNGLQN